MRDHAGEDEDLLAERLQIVAVKVQGAARPGNVILHRVSGLSINFSSSGDMQAGHGKSITSYLRRERGSLWCVRRNLRVK